MHVKAIFNLNVTRERRIELDVIGESYLVLRGLIFISFSVLVNVRLCFQLCGWVLNR